jgi:hypothetical protein
MRSAGIIPHPKFRVEAYVQEQFFYVEINAGPMKQCYKFSKELVSNLQELTQLLDEAFYTKCYSLFEEMYRNQQAATKRFSQTD